MFTEENNPSVSEIPTSCPICSHHPNIHKKTILWDTDGTKKTIYWCSCPYCDLKGDNRFTQKGAISAWNQFSECAKEHEDLWRQNGSE